MANSNWLNIGTDSAIASNNLFRGSVILNRSSLSDFAAFAYNPGDEIGLVSWFVNPVEWVSSVMMYPFTIPKRSTSSKTNIRIGGVTTDIQGYYLDYTTDLFDMGSVFIPKYFDNFCDYNGYTKIEVFLPFYGIIDVDTNEIMNKYLKFRLSIDYVTGMGTWYVCAGSDGGGSNSGVFINSDNSQILNTVNCQIGVQLPIGSSNLADVQRNLAVGAISTAMSSASVASDLFVRSQKNNNTDIGLEAGGNGGLFQTAIATASNARIRGTTEKTTNPLNGSNTTMCVKVIIYRPKLKDVDSNYYTVNGGPLMETRTLSTLAGYTEIDTYHLEGLTTATKDEIDLIDTYLKNGVIL